jgi:type I restriction enzyme S subunit
MSLPQYPKYTNSGVEWLGDIPENWRVVPIKHLGRLRGGAGFPHENQGIEGEELLFYKVNALAQADNLGVLQQTEDSIARETAMLLRAYIFPPRTIVFAKVGAALLLGRIRVLPAESCIDNNMMGLIVDQNEYDVEFVRFAMGTVRFDRLANPGAVPSLNESQIGGFPLATPQKEEQAVIARFLRSETRKIDALVDEQRRLIALLQEKRQAVIYHAITKGLHANACAKDSGVEWLGQIPASWSLQRLKHISPFITVGVVVNPSSFIADEGLPFIYGGDIREGIIDWKNSRRIDSDSSQANAKTILKAGDLLTVRVGAPGVTAVVPPECEGGNCASVMLVRQGKFNSNWLCYAMNTRIVRFQVEIVQYGAAQEQFNISHAVNFWVPLPPRTEQDEIADFLVCETTNIDGLIAEATSAVELLRERRTSLISAAVTGKIDVRGLVKEDAA